MNEEQVNVGAWARLYTRCMYVCMYAHIYDKLKPVRLHLPTINIQHINLRVVIIYVYTRHTHENTVVNDSKNVRSRLAQSLQCVTLLKIKVGRVSASPLTPTGDC